MTDIERRFDDVRRSECERKNRYATEGEARATADHQARKTGKELRVYACMWCRGWHLSSR
jgi:hypothetical protein